MTYVNEQGTYICRDCPRRCGADRLAGAGVCGADERLRVASVCLHRGEEPPISGERGAINVFFPGCNLRCLYCQNHQISRREFVPNAPAVEIDTLVRRIAELADHGGGCLNFVSPSHVTRQVVEIVGAVRRAGLRLPVVYNTNAYDALGALQRLDGLVNLYLPDLKYGLPAVARKLSQCPDYVEVAVAALGEMRRQVGVGLDCAALTGVIVRHLVLPGHVENSLRALELIAETLTPAVHLSLMAQYHPTSETESMSPAEMGDLNRVVSPEEYERVCEAAIDLGFENGWYQDPASPGSYRPDFTREHPFER